MGIRKGTTTDGRHAELDLRLWPTAGLRCPREPMAAGRTHRGIQQGYAHPASGQWDKIVT
jgi:hypothetical protein